MPRPPVDEALIQQRGDEKDCSGGNYWPEAIKVRRHEGSGKKGTEDEQPYSPGPSLHSLLFIVVRYSCHGFLSTSQESLQVARRPGPEQLG